MPPKLRVIGKVASENKPLTAITFQFPNSYTSLISPK